MNQRFKFPFERVLDFRAAKLSDAERQLAEAQRLIAELEERLRRLASDRVNCGPNLAAGKDVNGDELRALDAFRLRLVRDEEKFQQTLERARANLARCKALYADAQRDHRLLENLKKRRRHEWQQESDREAEKQSSDLFLSQWTDSRRRRG